MFAGDGQGSPRGAGPEAAAAVHDDRRRQGLADETLRLQEFSLLFDPERFAAHERFFVEEVGGWARSRFGVALPPGALRIRRLGRRRARARPGLRHPDVYGAVFSGSPGAGYEPAGVLPDRIPRTYLVAGTLEPFFLSNATRGRPRCAMRARMS